MNSWWTFPTLYKIIPMQWFTEVLWDLPNGFGVVYVDSNALNAPFRIFLTASVFWPNNLRFRFFFLFGGIYYIGHFPQIFMVVRKFCGQIFKFLLGFFFPRAKTVQFRGAFFIFPLENLYSFLGYSIVDSLLQFFPHIFFSSNFKTSMVEK